MHATSTRPPGTNRRMIPPAARIRSLGASFGTINSPLKRYTSLTVDDANAELWYYDLEFAKISLSHLNYGGAMLIATLPLGWRLSIYLLAGIGAGIANGIAGGGTFVTFPTLLATGAQALTANVTTTVGVVPSYMGGIRGFRFELRGHRDLLRSLVPSCVLGTAAGCALLL